MASKLSLIKFYFWVKIWNGSFATAVGASNITTTAQRAPNDGVWLGISCYDQRASILTESDLKISKLSIITAITYTAADLYYQPTDLTCSRKLSCRNPLLPNQRGTWSSRWQLSNIQQSWFSLLNNCRVELVSKEYTGVVEWNIN